jgi:transcriptional regulator GlxA family with amidase domain
MSWFRHVTGSLPFKVAACVALVYCAPRVASKATIAQAQTKHWVCPPCAAPCDGAVHDHPGTCPACGMALVEQGAPAAEPKAGSPVAVLVFDGAEIIDFSGPYEVFGAAGYDVYTVAETKTPVTTAMGMTVVPKYTFADAPSPTVVVVPGGAVGRARANEATLRWVKDVSAHADKTMSVCNGAFILGSAGLLDGLTATTTYRLIPKLAAELPKTQVVRDRRFVDNGKIVTTAGLSSGIDGALHVIEELRGKWAAQAAALSIEYDWHRDGAYVRAALADRLIPDVDLDAVGTWTVDHTEGTRDLWEVAVRGSSPKTGAEIAAHVGRALGNAKWRSIASTPVSSELRFEDETGKPWTGMLTVETAGAGGHEYLVKLRLARAG